MEAAPCLEAVQRAIGWFKVCTTIFVCHDRNEVEQRPVRAQESLLGPVWQREWYLFLVEQLIPPRSKRSS